MESLVGKSCGFRSGACPEMMPITYANPPYFSPHSAFTLAEVLWGEKYDPNACDPRETRKEPKLRGRAS